MQRVVVLGGGVGGTLAANLIARKLKRADRERARRRSRSSTRPASTPTSRATCTSRMGQERAEKLVRPERKLLDGNVEPRRRRDHPDRHRGADRHAGAPATELGYDQLVIATGSRIVPEELPSFDAEAHHFYSAEAAARLRTALDAFTGGRIVIGIAGHPVQVPAGAARGRVPRRVRAARARPARQDGDHLPVADQPRVHHRERVRHGDADLRGEGDPPRAPRRRRRDRRRAQGGHHRRVRGAPVRPPDLRPAAQGRAGRHRLRARAEVRLAADRPPHAPGQDDREAGAGPGRRGRPALPERLRPGRRDGPAAVEGRLDGPLRGADRRRAGRRRRARAASPRARTRATPARSCASSRSATGRARSSSSTTSTRPSRRSPNRMWHLGKIVFNKTYWHTVPRGRV